jgi:hypothetical protein
MRTLSNLDFLELWERGSGLHPLDRALLTLETTLPHEPDDVLADWPLGKRNAALVRFRAACFGQTLEGWVCCPQCDERLEFALDTEAFADNSGSEADPITIDGRIFRPPTSRDLASISRESDPHTAALRLLRQCCLDSGDLSGADLDCIGDLLAEADPLAETLVNLRCAECGHQWEEELDIAAWLWVEIEARARRLLFDVHTLATAYGWSEHEILSLSEPRRTLYLEMVQA